MKGPGEGGRAGTRPTGPRRVPAATVAAMTALGALTLVVGLVISGRMALSPGTPSEKGTVFYVVPYHYGFAFYDSGFVERQTMEVKAGGAVTLVVVPSLALPKETFLEYARRAMGRAIGDLPAGDPRIERKIFEDLELGNVEHIVGIAGHPVYVTTNVTAVLGGARFRREGPRTLEEAVRQGDPTIKSVTFTAKRIGAFDVICVDSGMDGSGTCGWGHKWMVAKGAFIVRP